MAGFTQKTKEPIVLENERSAGIEKIKNDTGAWGFFKYLYGKYSFKILLLNLLMIVFAIAVYLLNQIFSLRIAGEAAALPYSSTFGLAITPWGGTAQFYANIVNKYNTQKALWMMLAIPLITVPVSGGFAVVRDAYWTGKFSIFKTFFKGVYQTGLQVLPFIVLIAAGFLGIHFAGMGLAAAGVASWIAVTLKVIMYIAVALIAIYGLVFAGVVTLYDQSFALSLKSAFQLTVRGIISHIISFVMTGAIFVLLLINMNLISIIVLTIIIMFGMIFAALVWMIHMIKVCGAGKDAE